MCDNTIGTGFLFTIGRALGELTMALGVLGTLAIILLFIGRDKRK